MKKIKKTNYIIVLILLIFTILVTLFLSKIYLNKTRVYSLAYQEFNKIRINEITEYVMENPTLIMYIGNKYDIEKENEHNLIKKLKINELDKKIIYIDVSQKNKNFQNNLEKEYNVHIDLNNMPILLFLIDGKVTNTIYIDDVTDMDKIIELGDFQ